MELKIKSGNITYLIASLQKIASKQSLSGIVLFGCSLLALTLANSKLSYLYESFWKIKIGFSILSLNLNHSLHHWINDGLMAIFFFTIGLEIKREFLRGELSSKDKILLPILAAVGGALIPAAIYTLFNINTTAVHGWGIPMATDIAFVLGIITLLGKNVPASLKVFILAFAIIDDLIAIMIIAVFYTSNIEIISLLLGLILILIAFILNYFKYYHSAIYLSIGILSWLMFSNSGIHPTVAGVMMALSIPDLNGTKKNKQKSIFSILVKENDKKNKYAMSKYEKQKSGASEIEMTSESNKSPIDKLEHRLHPISSYIIMPIFAAANAGIFIDSTLLNSMTHHISLGIISALVIGKPIGIFLPIWLSVKLKYASLPTKAGWLDILAVACLGGMGFTLSLFISVLAFKDQSMLIFAKIGVLTGSLISIILGVIIFKFKKQKNKMSTN